MREKGINMTENTYAEIKAQVMATLTSIIDDDILTLEDFVKILNIVNAALDRKIEERKQSIAKILGHVPDDEELAMLAMLMQLMDPEG